MARKATMLGRRTVGSHMMTDPLDELGLVAFDFDGTMTVRDSFTAFLAWRAGGLRYAVGCLKLSPAVIAYLFHRNRGRLKAAAVREFLKGAPQGELQEQARLFAEKNSGRLLRPDAVETWRRWRTKGAKTVIVTASPDFVVAPFARGLGADGLIGTELAFDADGRCIGVLAGLNCRGPEKVRRLKETYGEDLRLTAAYGDTSGDTDMLAIAEEKGYRVFTARP
ncbi:MAG: HAD-IB family hydrolase [Caulobacter sp.]|nr:HAD-IB family hydrolase [Caulobacter sp.]